MQCLTFLKTRNKKEKQQNIFTLLCDVVKLTDFLHLGYFIVILIYIVCGVFSFDSAWNDRVLYEGSSANWFECT